MYMVILKLMQNYPWGNHKSYINPHAEDCLDIPNCDPPQVISL